MFPLSRNTGLEATTRVIGMFPIIQQSRSPKSFFNFQLSIEQLRRCIDSESLLRLNRDEKRNKSILEVVKIH